MLKEITIHGFRVIYNEEMESGVDYLRNDLDFSEARVFFDQARQRGSVNFEDDNEHQFVLAFRGNVYHLSRRGQRRKGLSLKRRLRRLFKDSPYIYDKLKQIIFSRYFVFGAGLISLLGLLIRDYSFWIFIIATAIAVLVSIIYSYLVFRRQKF